MPIRIKARTGESAEQMMRRFKKLCEKEGLTKDMKRRAYYEKPSERKQRALRKTLKRMEMIRLGIPPRNARGPAGAGGAGGTGGNARGGPGNRGGAGPGPAGRGGGGRPPRR